MHKLTMLQCNDQFAFLRGGPKGRYRNVFQLQPAVLEVEIGLTSGSSSRKFTAGDIIRNKAEYYSAKPISAKETLRSQKGLVYAVAINPTIDDSPSRELF